MSAIAIMIPLLLVTLFVRASLHLVAARQAAIICDRLTGQVRGLIAGPGPAFLVPLVEHMLPFDLTWRTMRVTASDVMTRDDFTVSASADITFALDAALMQAADLNQVLPFLDSPEDSIRPRAAHILHSLVGEYGEASLLRRSTQAQLTRQLQRELQAAVTPLCIRIHAIRLLCQRDFRLVEAQLNSRARAMQWEKLSETLGQGFDPTRLLPFEALARLEGKDARLIAAFGRPVERGFARGFDSQPVQWVLDTR